MIAVAPALESLTWQIAVYAVLSLTLIRMLPVAVALLGTGLGRGSVVFVGWFGPRGLASVVFGLLALEALGEQVAKPAVAVIAFTVLLSVVAHGLTAEPLAKRYGPRLGPAEHSAGAAWLVPVPVRRLVRRSHAARHPDAAAQGRRDQPVTTDQVLFGVGLILVLAVGSQVLASRLRIPALIVLLPAGFIAGALTSDVNPQRLLGAAFQPLVSLAVAVILYDAGLALDLAKLRGHTRRVVRRLITRGVAVTLVFGAVSAGLLLGMSAGAALMTGAILVVSWPTVVGPLLRFIRPSERLQRVLAWEGSLIDPVGGILGAVVFHAVLASSHGDPLYQVGQFLISIAVGVAGAVIGVALLWFCLRKLDLGEVLGTTSPARLRGGGRGRLRHRPRRRRAHRRDPDGTGAGQHARLRHPRPGGRSSRPWCS